MTLKKIDVGALVAPLALLAFATLGGCISSGPPAPPVRWLDPTAGLEAPPAGAPVAPVALQAQPHLGQEIAVRIEPAVVVYDTDHRWLVPPQELVRRAFGRAQVAVLDAVAGAELRVELQTFELQQLAGAPGARIVCRVVRSGERAAPGVRVEVSASAEDASSESLTAAMGRALQQLVARVLAAASS